MSEQSTSHILLLPLIALFHPTLHTAPQPTRPPQHTNDQVTVSVDLPGGTDPSGVFLSLSGSAGFKQNTRLGSDKTITFQGLQPGTYYLKPLLREHSFEPPVADLTLDDGQQMQLTLRAVRTAWGISGAVTSGGVSVVLSTVLCSAVELQCWRGVMRV